MAVLVETVMLPFASVEVTGTKTATGTVGKVVTEDGGGVMMILLDAGANVFEMAGGKSFAVSGTSEVKSTGITIGAGVVVGAIPGAGERAKGANIVIDKSCVSTRLGFVGAGEEVIGSMPLAGCNASGTLGFFPALPVYAGDCRVAAGVSVKVGPSSASVEVEVFVRYNAVCNAAIGSAQEAVTWQFQTPRPGKKDSIRIPSSHAWPCMARKVQPLGSSWAMPTLMVCTASGRSG